MFLKLIVVIVLIKDDANSNQGLIEGWKMRFEYFICGEFKNQQQLVLKPLI